MRAPRIILFVLGFVVASIGVTAAIRSALDRAEIEPEMTRHEVARYYRDKALTVGQSVDWRSAYKVMFLGNSMVVSYPMNLQIPVLLEREVAMQTRGRPIVRIYNLGMAGTGVFDYYFMADVLASARPDLVVIQFDLTSSSQRFRRAFSRPELAGFVAPDRVLESALLPGSWVGLNLDRLLLYMGIIHAGGFEPWVRFAEEQNRVIEGAKHLGAWLAFREGAGSSPEDVLYGRRLMWSLKVNNSADGNRYSETAMRMHLGAALDGLPDDDPTTVMLGAAVRSFRNRGVDVLVYVNPVNVDHVEKLGIMNPRGLDQSLALVERVVSENGGTFVDLHAIFPDEGFRDKPGHFAYEGDFNGPWELARRLMPHVLKKARPPAQAATP